MIGRGLGVVRAVQWLGCGLPRGLFSQTLEALILKQVFRLSERQAVDIQSALAQRPHEARLVLERVRLVRPLLQQALPPPLVVLAPHAVERPEHFLRRLVVSELGFGIDVLRVVEPHVREHAPAEAEEPRDRLGGIRLRGHHARQLRGQESDEQVHALVVMVPALVDGQHALRAVGRVLHGPDEVVRPGPHRQLRDLDGVRRLVKSGAAVDAPPSN
mmetsp:Transcript_23093/g.65462  ORF Transcript_23093/g.65462 Transcript_23093/m.65462 type:complete len:216 (-) Transcript_23093:513-1160(-)